ncbi:MAG: hypothetical protein OHK0023_08290 [Anaerolineae bacterium]
MTKTPSPATPQPAICDYEGSTYRTDFWEGKGRDYEDAVERIILRQFLPKAARRYVDFGAGFGRLINEADRYDEVVIMDYSSTMLQDAQARLGRADRYIYVNADVYRLPFAPDSFDAGLLCRVIHHLADAPTALKQIRRSFAAGGTFILEYANKLNLKAMLRYALRRQNWSPYDLAPLEFVKLNFDFHPAYITRTLKAVGFTPRRRRAASWLRLGAFKKLLPLQAMVTVDRLLQPIGAVMPYSPQIFVENTVEGDAPISLTPRAAMFICPITGAPLHQEGDRMVSTADNPQWAIRDGIYDFKTPISA